MCSASVIHGLSTSRIKIEKINSERVVGRFAQILVLQKVSRQNRQSMSQIVCDRIISFAVLKKARVGTYAVETKIDGN